MSLTANINLRAMSATHSVDISQVGTLPQVLSGYCGTRATAAISATVGSTAGLNMGTTASSGRQGMRNGSDALLAIHATVPATKEVLTIPGGAGELSVESNFVGAQRRAGSSVPNISTYVESLSDAAGRNMDAGFAYEAGEMSRLQAMRYPCVASLSSVRGINQSVVATRRQRGETLVCIT